LQRTKALGLLHKQVKKDSTKDDQNAESVARKYKKKHIGETKEDA